MMESLVEQFATTLRDAAAHRAPLRIRGSGSKDFHAHALAGKPLATGAFRGIVDYEPSELVITARAGTPLAEVEQALAGGGQMLAFEPPHFGPDATLGGCIAAGFSGPRRPYAGSARDYVLGVRMLDGRGRDLSFGGQVMKNVAGFDLSRLMAGSFGTLGLLLEVSLKVLPRPERELTLGFETDAAGAIARMNSWGTQPLPLSATCHADGLLRVRLSGAAPAVEAARARLGGDPLAEDGFWEALREQRLPAFGTPLWRLSVKPTAAPLALPGSTVLEWGGALRWVSTDAPDAQVHEAARRAGGHALRFRGGSGALFELAPAVLRLHRDLKAVLDPDGILGPGRLHPAF